MYKIMIVDDELPALDYLEHLVDYEKYGFEIVCRARSGKDGLKQHEIYQPDLIITDVVMPGMTGLEMTDRILEKDPACMMVLLTAYNEFDYAMKAIQLEVKSYILKHEVSEEVLSELLVKLKGRMDEMRAARQLEQWTEYGNYFSGRSCSEELIRSAFEKKGGIQKILLVLNFSDEIPEISKKSAARWQKLLDECGSGPGNSTEQRKETAFEAVLLCLQRKQAVLCLHTRKNHSHGRLSEVILAVSLKLVHFMKEEYGISVHIGVSREIPDFGQLRSCYEEASGAIRVSFFKPQNMLFFAERPGVQAKDFQQQREKAISDLSEYAKVWDMAGVTQTLQHLLLNIHLYLSDHAFFHDDMEQVIGILYRQCGISVKEAYEVVEQAADIYEVLKGIRELLEKKYGTIEENYSAKILLALNYIRQNLQNPITLVEVAEALELNSAYFSQLFKQEVGMNFKTYVNEKKMERAEELLKSGRYKIYEVSELMGFQTVQHFSNTFKKVTGHAPGEYKN